MARKNDLSGIENGNFMTFEEFYEFYEFNDFQKELSQIIKKIFMCNIEFNSFTRLL